MAPSSNSTLLVSQRPLLWNTAISASRPLSVRARAICDASGAAVELLWASPREILNVVQAEAAGAHIITVPPDMLKKLDLLGKDLAEHSLDTVKMFHRDAAAAGYEL